LGIRFSGQPAMVACLRCVGDAGEQPAQLDGGRQFTALPEDGADRSGICLTDDEHRWSMGRRGVASNPDLPTDVPASTAKEINHGR
jgi:hypothetical protein